MQPVQIGGQKIPPWVISTPRFHQHINCISAVQHPFGEGIQTCCLFCSPAGPHVGGMDGHHLPCPAGLVYFLIHLSTVARALEHPRHAGKLVGWGEWRPVPTQEESLICISFSSFYRAAGCESILTAAVSKVQAAAIASDWLKTPMAVC